MVDGLSISCRKSRFSITIHHTFERIYSVFIAEVCLVRVAVVAVATLAVEDGNHMISGSQVVDSSSHALHDSAKH